MWFSSPFSFQAPHGQQTPTSLIHIKALPLSLGQTLCTTHASTRSKTQGRTISQDPGQEGNGGAGIAVMDIQATPDRVWQIITSFEKYPDWIDENSVCEGVWKDLRHHRCQIHHLNAMMIGWNTTSPFAPQIRWLPDMESGLFEGERPR